MTRRFVDEKIARKYMTTHVSIVVTCNSHAQGSYKSYIDFQANFIRKIIVDPQTIPRKYIPPTVKYHRVLFIAHTTALCFSRVNTKKLRRVEHTNCLFFSLVIKHFYIFRRGWKIAFNKDNVWTKNYLLPFEHSSRIACTSRGPLFMRTHNFFSSTRICDWPSEMFCPVDFGQ